jgi:hypothetical protein
MKYYIISKVELGEDEQCKYTDIGQTDDVNIANEINEQYDSTLGKFVGENLTKLDLGIVVLSTFFKDTPFVTEANTIVKTVEGLNLKKINNISELK